MRYWSSLGILIQCLGRQFPICLSSLSILSLSGILSIAPTRIWTLCRHSSSFTLSVSSFLNTRPVLPVNYCSYSLWGHVDTSNLLQYEFIIVLSILPQIPVFILLNLWDHRPSGSSTIKLIVASGCWSLLTLNRCPSICVPYHAWKSSPVSSFKLHCTCRRGIPHYFPPELWRLSLGMAFSPCTSLSPSVLQSYPQW